MSVVELKWWLERHVTFSKQDIFKDLGSAIPGAKHQDMETTQVASIATPTTIDARDMEAKTEDRRTPPVGFTASPDAKDTQSSPTRTQVTDDNISLLPRCQPEDKTENR